MIFLDGQGQITTAYGEPSPGLVMVKNAFGLSDGMIGDATGAGNQTIERYFPGAVISGNLFSGQRAELYPSGNYFAAENPPRIPELYGADESLLPMAAA